MAAKENKKLKVRHASLEDASGISAIHRSHVERWYRRLGAEHYDVPYGSLSLSERWGFGGPWMSVETCAIHLNNILLRRQLPIVAQKGERLVGEMELFLGKEGDLYGNNLHIGLLYVRKDSMGRGVGKALVDKAIEIGGAGNCDTATVVASPANAGFYEKFGFERCEAMVELGATVRPYDVDISPLSPPLNIASFARGMSMPIGRYQSSAFHLCELLDTYAIPEFLNCRRDRAFVSVNGHPSLLAFIKYDVEPARADVYGWTSGASVEELAFAALTLLHGEGVMYASILLAGDDYKAAADKLDAAVKGSRSTLLRRLK